jgi:hypothetical protein
MFILWIKKIPGGSKPSYILKKKVLDLLNLIIFDNYLELDKSLGSFLT